LPHEACVRFVQNFAAHRKLSKLTPGVSSVRANRFSSINAPPAKLAKQEGSDANGPSGRFFNYDGKSVIPQGADQKALFRRVRGSRTDRPDRCPLPTRT